MIPEEFFEMCLVKRLNDMVSFIFQFRNLFDTMQKRYGFITSLPGLITI